MFRRLKILVIMAAATAALPSCIHDSMDHCGAYLEFIFDYNMEFTDSFSSQIDVADVYFFDADGRYLFSRTAPRDELRGGKRMFLGGDIPFGTYRILTVGGLCDMFRMCDLDGNDFIVGTTTIEQVKLALICKPGEVSHEFPHIWFGETVVVNYQADLTVWPVRLMRNTNKFNLVLTRVDAAEGGSSRADTSQVPYTFEIVTPEGAEYGYNNAPLTRRTTTYTPYSLTPGDGPENLSAGHMNTCRLFCDDQDGYRLIVRNARTLKEAWNYDLMTLLELTKPTTYPDMPLQEYLDRQGEWNIVILHRGSGTDEEHDAFAAIGIKVNGWLKWFHDIGIE